MVQAWVDCTRRVADLRRSGPPAPGDALRSVDSLPPSRVEQRARRSRFRRRLQRLWSRLNQPVATMRNAGRSRPGPQPRINKKLGWGGSSPLKRSMRLLVYGGGLFLLGMLAWAVPAVLMDHSFALDERCENKALSCGVLASFLVPVLTLALASAFFLLGRLWYLRRRYLRTARSKPQEVV